MNISIYSDYLVNHTYTYSYKSFDYDDFQTKTETEILKMDGGTFLDKVIADSIKRQDFSNIGFFDNIIYIDIFDPMTGHTEEHRYELKEI